jgi:hypothetical protein
MLGRFGQKPSLIAKHVVQKKSFKAECRIPGNPVGMLRKTVGNEHAALHVLNAKVCCRDFSGRRDGSNVPKAVAPGRPTFVLVKAILFVLPA